MDKLGKISLGRSVIYTLTGILLIMIIGAGITWYTSGTIYGKELTAEPAPKEGEPVVDVCDVACPSDQTTTGKPRFQVDLDVQPTLTYADGVNVYFIPQNGGELTNTTTTGTTGAYPSGVDLDCKEPYVAVAVDSQGVTGSGVSEQFTACGAEGKVTVIGTRITELQARVKDNDNDGYIYHNKTSPATTYQNITRGATAWNSTTTQGTALNITKDTTYDFSLFIKTTNGNYQWGNIGYTFEGKSPRTIIAVDMDVSDYQEPSVAWQGTTKADIMSSLNTDDQNVLSSYEYAYEISPMGSNAKEFNIVFKSKSGVDPDADPQFRILSEGLFKSSEQADKILMGIFDDSTSQTEVHGRDARIILDTI